MDNYNSITLFGWMINQYGLRGKELLVYATLFSLTQSPDLYSGNIHYLTEWADLESEEQTKRILSDLIDMGLVETKEFEIDGVLRIYYRCVG